MKAPLHQPTCLSTVRRWWGATINSLRLNAIAYQFRDGRWFIIKRRTVLGRCLTPVANLFFRLARLPIAFRRGMHAWQKGELSNFRLLNPGFAAARIDGVAIRQEQLPGQDLWLHLRRGTLTRRMVRAAGQEFRRVHGLWCDFYDGPWSHADGAMRNVLYDPATHRARLIDFELYHDPRLSPRRRHADDLAAFLLDLASRAPRRRWLAYALNFLHAYGDATILAPLRRALARPTGLAGLWWKVRTNFVNEYRVTRRMARLRRTLEHSPGAAYFVERPYLATSRSSAAFRLSAAIRAASPATARRSAPAPQRPVPAAAGSRPRPSWSVLRSPAPLPLRGTSPPARPGRWAP